MKKNNFIKKSWRKYKQILIRSSEQRSELRVTGVNHFSKKCEILKFLERKLIVRKKVRWYNKTPTTLKALNKQQICAQLAYKNFSLRSFCFVNQLDTPIHDRKQILT